MTVSFEYKCLACEFSPENSNDLEEHLIWKHSFLPLLAKIEAEKQHKEMKEYYRNLFAKA